MRALVIGSGISGLACAAELATAGVEVTVRDRGRAPGGRLASRTLRDTGTAFDGRVVDHGASYFTARDPGFLALVEALRDRGVVREWTDAFHIAGPSGLTGVRVGPMRYAAPAGLRSVAEALADALTAGSVHQERQVQRVEVRREGLFVDGEAFDRVAVCMPAPQALRIAEVDLPQLHSPVWEPVIAVTLVFAERTWGEVDGVFVNDDVVLTWIADDGRRRGDDAPVLVAHVHPVLSARHLAEPDRVIPEAVAAVRRVLGIAEHPEWVEAHRWTYARPLAAHPEPYALGSPGLGFAGDAFAAGPRVEAAWLSGAALGRALGEMR